MRKVLFWVIFIVLIYGSVEFLSYGGLIWAGKYRHLYFEPVDVISDRHRRILNKHLQGESGYLVLSPALGWTIKEDGKSSLYRANSDGIRSNHEYKLTPPENVLRIAAFGDSYTHGDEVGNDATWQAVLENRNPRLEVMNFGVGGYGLDQAYLRYLEHGQQYKPHIVFIGFMPGNIFRHVNTFRPFYKPDTGLPLAKPRFTVTNSALTLVTNPLPSRDDYSALLSRPQAMLSRLGAGDYYYPRRYKSGYFDFSPTSRLVSMLASRMTYDPGDGIIRHGRYDEKSEAFKITTSIFDRFYSDVTRNTATPVIVVFPSRSDVERYRRDGVKVYSPLLSHLDAANYKYIDLMEAFGTDASGIDVGDIFDGHYSRQGNELVAAHISVHLARTGLPGRERTIPQN